MSSLGEQFIKQVLRSDPSRNDTIQVNPANVLRADSRYLQPIYGTYRGKQVMEVIVETRMNEPAEYKMVTVDRTEHTLTPEEAEVFARAVRGYKGDAPCFTNEWCLSWAPIGKYFGKEIMQVERRLNPYQIWVTYHDGTKVQVKTQHIQAFDDACVEMWQRPSPARPTDTTAVPVVHAPVPPPPQKVRVVPQGKQIRRVSRKKTLGEHA